jgi:predicted dehydrogenase
MKAIPSALLSYGMSGRIFHAPFLEIHPGFELVGAYERSQKNIQKAYPGTHSYVSLDEVIQDSDIELIIVNTPIPTHFDYAAKALKAGKHVVVEKAFTNSTLEALELQKIAREAGKHIFVYQNRRWDSDFLTVKKVFESGQLGDIVEAEFHFDRFNGIKSPKMHKEIPGPGAGIIFDLGPHIIDQALYLFGNPTHVFADLRKTRPGTEVEDLFEILLYYPEMRVRLKAGYYFKVPVPAFQLHGKLGSFIKTRSDRQEADLDAGRKPQGDTWGQESPQDYGVMQVDGGNPERISSEKGDFMAFYENVYQSLRGDAKPSVSVQDGINSMRVIDAAIESSREKRVINY